MQGVASCPHNEDKIRQLFTEKTLWVHCDRTRKTHRLCRFFWTSVCRFGEDCWYVHGLPCQRTVQKLRKEDPSIQPQTIVCQHAMAASMQPHTIKEGILYPNLGAVVYKDGSQPGDLARFLDDWEEPPCILNDLGRTQSRLTELCGIQLEDTEAAESHSG